VTRITAADDLVDEAAIGGQIVEVARPPHQQRVIDGPLEMTMRPFDGAVVMRDAGIEFTRCRPYRKNDQAFVEQKNGRGSPYCRLSPA
jgi:hypothetical protein